MVWHACFNVWYVTLLDYSRSTEESLSLGVLLRVQVLFALLPSENLSVSCDFEPFRGSLSRLELVLALARRYLSTRVSTRLGRSLHNADTCSARNSTLKGETGEKKKRKKKKKKKGKKREFSFFCVTSGLLFFKRRRLPPKNRFVPFSFLPLR